MTIQNEDRRLLAESVDAFARRASNSESQMTRVRHWRDRDPGFDLAVWREMAQLGWLGLMVPERFGGMELGIGDMVVVAEGLGAQLFPEPLVPCAVLAARALTLCENDSMSAQLLPKLAAGELLAALAFQESAGDLGSEELTTKLRIDSGRIHVTGKKQFVAGAAAAHGFIVSARDNSGVNLVWIPSDAQGLELKSVAMADGRFSGELRITDVELAESHLLAGANKAPAALATAVEEAKIAVCAELVGLISTVFDMTLDYLRTRVQFDKPIGSFQSLQHRAVDLYIQQQLAKASLADAVRAMERAPGEATTVACTARAKARCSHASALITRQAVQMHGAIGFTEDSDVGLFLKRALTLNAWLGNESYQRRRFAALAPAQVD